MLPHSHSPTARSLAVSHLKNGSPATVSRAGVLFLNESDVGWHSVAHMFDTLFIAFWRLRCSSSKARAYSVAQYPM